MTSALKGESLSSGGGTYPIRVDDGRENDYFLSLLLQRLQSLGNRFDSQAFCMSAQLQVSMTLLCLGLHENFALFYLVPKRNDGFFLKALCTGPLGLFIIP